MKTKIKKIADIWVGYQPKGRAEHEAEGTHRLIQIKDLREDGGIEYDSLLSITPDRGSGRFQVQDGDVLFSARGKYNTAHALGKVPSNMLAGGNFFVVRVKKNDVMPEYLAWFLNQPATQERIKGLMMGTNIPYISKGSFADLEFLLPSLETQNRICQLVNLQQMEKRLLVELAAKREKLVQALCYQAARQGEKG